MTLGNVNKEDLRGQRQRPRVTTGVWWHPHCVEEDGKRNRFGVGKKHLERGESVCPTGQGPGGPGET